ncbi:MAG: chromosome segregation protein SMC [Lachnospiraceae bacterium]|nr:chromosome segregation protein SMC [Lachnospiraceae bacterium]
MYLKSIEMQGFKSFATKIQLDFHDGITGIVGPNGSGKSNISDAVRWVLGEQSAKQLRGASMQDVIFSGTENRKPLSYAYVAITLDNSDHVLDIDYEEVTVSRRVYRSGESEYLINGTECRLKDVQELFFDTGIGKEGYSIIGQGQIERILSGKPEDRRELFDEAAGIVKFKKRKATAEKKLEHERENLVRVNDIIAELEHRVGPLEKQSEKAKIYLARKEELKNFDINLFLIEMEQFVTQQDELENKYEIANAELEETKEKNARIKSEYDRLDQELEALDASIEETRNTISDTELKKNDLEGRVELLKEQIKSSSTSDEIHKGRVESLNKDKEEKQKELAEFEKQKEEFIARKEEIEAKKTEVSSKLFEIKNKIAELNNKIEDGKQEILNLINEKANIQASQASKNSDLEHARIRKAELNKELLTKKQEDERLSNTVEEYRKKCDEITDSITELKRKWGELKTQDNEWKEKLSTLQESMEKNSLNFHKTSSKLESLRNIAERYDGYGNSIKKVMEQKDKEKGILGVVSDLIKVEKKYEVAVETSLGGNIQNIVTDNEDTAKKMIRFLKENRLGRATFLPLTSVQGNKDKQSDEVRDEKGVIGYADELIQADSKYDEVISYLVGRNVVVDTLDNATALARKYKYKLHIVTLEGEYLRAGGSMTGGAFKNSSNLLSRNREIEELQKQVETLKTAIENGKKREEEIATARELLGEDASKIEDALQEKLIEENTLNLQLEQAVKDREESKANYEKILEESKGIDKSMEDINKEKNDFLESIKSKDDRADEINNEAKVIEEQIAELQKEEEEFSASNTEIGTKEVTITNRISFVEDSIGRVNSEIGKINEDIAEVSGKLESAKSEIETKQKEIEDTEGAIENAGKVLESLKEKLNNDQKKKEELNASHKEFFNQRDEIAENLSKLDKEVFRLSEQKEKITASMNDRTAYMWDEYELTPHAAMEYRNEELGTRGQLKTKITDTKNEIKALGEVNVNAIEEYKEVSERFEFLNGQRNDLVLAEETLMNIIAELDEGMRKQFSEKFADIQKEFDKAFKELFGGGKGTLELVEGEDILETGIRIIAQPPGKKLQSMVLLSGGEKSLTAIALLFAIQNLKPSPFCLLDEIEAALDDSNVSRFANYLHKLTKNTQFIVITHRKGTMTAADRLYGITMQEKGVSTLVSVSLIESELEK